VSAPKVIGIQAHWQCEACIAMQTTHHIATVAEATPLGEAMIRLNPPTGWKIRERRVFCPEHAPKRFWR
jgi:hypothetical protein